MKYLSAIGSVFIERLNRFSALVSIGGAEETVHVKNTGRLGELLIKGAACTLSRAENPARKTRFDLISVEKPDLGWVNVDSLAPNAVVGEWLGSHPREFSDMTCFAREKTYGSSRFDFYVEYGGKRAFIEVKGCTLEKDGKGYFPDAPTERGVKHLTELVKAKSEGFECFAAFVIAMNGVDTVLANKDADPAFSAALEKAEQNGVGVVFIPCRVTPDGITVIPEGVRVKKDEK